MSDSLSPAKRGKEQNQYQLCGAGSSSFKGIANCVTNYLCLYPARLLV